MREAKRRGGRIVIVSNTCPSEAQLRGLIAAAAGENFAGLVDRLFCSSVYGKSKREGLYELVLKELGVQPDEILHIGDNPVADVGGSPRLGSTPSTQAVVRGYRATAAPGSGGEHDSGQLPVRPAASCR
ncbi:hypothetical protein LZ586_06110 [Sphingomonas sp. S2-65]|nr:HAD family hydrolase [Sphingomonas sp. S2-65]UYY59655.1 hypothetical protein LZ586_06110 [Sphingomonas sp. S2-65]